MKPVVPPAFVDPCLFLDFATGPDGLRPGNFRDLSAALTRMATLAPGGRISRDVVNEEIARLEHAWRRSERTNETSVLEDLLGLERMEGIDLFDRVQLATVVRVCRESRSMSDAGRKLFAASRAKRSSVNDSDRLRKCLGKYGLCREDMGG